MKRKISILVLIFLSICILLTGCGQSKPNNIINEKESNVVESKGKEKGNNFNKRLDVYGKVKKIIGNEVTLDLVELPERINKEREKLSQDNKEEIRGKVKEQTQNSPEERKGKMSSEIKFSGETKTLIIPVGVPINSTQKSENKELNLSDISKGSFLQIFYNENNKDMISNVRVIQER